VLSDKLAADDPGADATWDIRVEAQTNQPDPVRLDEFLESQITEENRRKLLKWIK
jgi:hypothetical protein